MTRDGEVFRPMVVNRVLGRFRRGFPIWLYCDGNGGFEVVVDGLRARISKQEYEEIVKGIVGIVRDLWRQVAKIGRIEVVWERDGETSDRQVIRAKIEAGPIKGRLLVGWERDGETHFVAATSIRREMRKIARGLRNVLKYLA